MKTMLVALTAIFTMLLLANYSLAQKNSNTTIKVINPIVVPNGKESEALAIWDSYAGYFSQQPGFIGTKLHRSMDQNAKFHLINIAEWKSAEDFTRALHSEEIKKIGNGFPKDMPHYPSLYQIIRDE